MMNRPASIRQRHSSSGFSLLELSLVMLIIGIILSGVIFSVSSTLENASRNSTRLLLAEVSEALYGYAQLQGRLPCPSTAASAGFESPLGGGVCTTYHGFVPGATLGISGTYNEDGLLVDAWQNPLRYSVGATSEVNGGFTSANDIQTLFENPPLSASPPLLRVCNLADCSDTVNTNTSPAVILSMGGNWNVFSGASSAAELANASGASDGGYPLTNTNDFVSARYAEESYDDLVIWLSPQILFSRLISAGKLP